MSLRCVSCKKKCPKRLESAYTPSGCYTCDGCLCLGQSLKVEDEVNDLVKLATEARTEIMNRTFDGATDPIHGVVNLDVVMDNISKMVPDDMLIAVGLVKEELQQEITGSGNSSLEYTMGIHSYIDDLTKLGDTIRALKSKK